MAGVLHLFQKRESLSFSEQNQNLGKLRSTPNANMGLLVFLELEAPNGERVLLIPVENSLVSLKGKKQRGF